MKYILSIILMVLFNGSIVYAYNYDEIECLAKNIYFEARDQNISGQEAVAFVTLNRVKSDKYPNSICNVVWQRRQFSWTHDGKSDIPRDRLAWDMAMLLAIFIYEHQDILDDPTYGAIMYHADYVRPYWVNSYRRTLIIGNHIFYREHR